MRLMTNNTYTGTTTVSGAHCKSMVRNPKSPVQISGARLQGSGTVGHITFSGDGPNVSRLAAVLASSPAATSMRIPWERHVGDGVRQCDCRDRLRPDERPGHGNLTGLKLSGSLGFASTVGNQFTIITTTAAMRSPELSAG